MDFCFADNTPILRHKRVAELQQRSHSVSPEVRSTEMELVDRPWPAIEEVYEPHEITPRMRAAYEAGASAHEYSMLNDTPNTKRRRLEEYSKIGSPEIRAFLSPSYPSKEHQRHLEAERRRAEEMKPSPSPEKKQSTVISHSKCFMLKLLSKWFFTFQPWTVYKRRFWKSALGDQYESPSQCYTVNTQKLQTTITDAVEEPAVTDLTEDKNLKPLTDFIKKRNILKDLSVDEDPVPDSIPYSAEMGK